MADAITPPVEKPAAQLHVPNNVRARAGANSFRYATLTGSSTPSPRPVRKRHAQNDQNESAHSAVARLKTVAIHNAPTIATRRPNRSEIFPCTAAAHANP